MDILVRCIRAAMLHAEGVRRDTTLELLLLGGEHAPLALRLEGPTVRFLRPDERRNAVTLQRALAAWRPGAGPELVAPGITALPMSLQQLVESAWGGDLFMLARDGADLRDTRFGDKAATFVVGDDLGLTGEERELLLGCGAVPVSLGPTEVHAEDALAIVHNELDRRSRAREKRACGVGADPAQS